MKCGDVMYGGLIFSHQSAADAHRWAAVSTHALVVSFRAVGRTVEGVGYGRQTTCDA